MSDVRLITDAKYQLRGGGQRVLLYFVKSSKRPPRKIQLWQRVEVLRSEPNDPESVSVNLRGEVVWVNLLDGPQVATTGYVPFSLFTSGRFVLDGRG